MYVCVPRTWFCPVFHGARPVPSTTGVGHFFPVSTYSPFTGPCMCVPRTWFCPGFHVRTSRSVHDGGRPLFPRVHVQPVHGSVYVCVPRTWFCPVFHGAHPLPSTTGVGHFFPVSPCTSLCTWFCLIFHGARPVPSTTLARVSFNTFFVMTSHV